MLPVNSIGVTFLFAAGESPRLISIEGAPENVLGFDSHAFLSSAGFFQERIHPGDADVIRRFFAADGPASGVECLRMRHSDGRIRCLQADFHAARADGSRQVSILLQDARALWNRKRRPDDSDHLRAAIDNTATEVFFKDRNHVFTAASKPFRCSVSERLGGADLVGLTDYDFLPEEDADAYYALENQVLSQGDSVHDIREIVRLAGKAWIEVNECPVRSPSGEVIGLFTTAANLTQRIEAEERVYEANQALPEAAKLPPIGTYILDIRRGAFATSASIDTMLGLPEGYPHDMEGWASLVHPADREPLLKYMEDVIATPGRIFNREYRAIRPSDGEMRWVQGIGRIDRDRQGSPVLMRGSVQDITERKATEAALRETKSRLEMFIEHAPAALAMYDRNMCYLAVSRRWRQLYGVSGDIIGCCHYDVVSDIPERWKTAHARALEGEPFTFTDERFERANGSVIWMRGEVMPWRESDASIGGIVISIEDITERKQAQARLELAASVFADASEAIFVTDVAGNIIETNDSFTRVTGYARAEVLGRHSHILRSDRHDEDFYAGLEDQVMGTGRWRGEQWFRRKDGSEFQVSATITTVFDGNGKAAHFVGLFFDVTPMKEQERQLEKAVNYDQLTGLPNRNLALDRLRTANAAAGQSGHMVGLILLDLDNFKGVNEAVGRDAADALLVATASRMKDLLREGDTLGRIGGDEFIVVLPNLVETAAATQAVERLLSAASSPVAHGTEILQMSATAGVTFFPQAEEVDADQMIRQAVQAMYEAKLAGKDRYQVFDSARDYNLRGKLEKIGRIRQALKAGEFVLHYQPKVNMATGALLGAEALIRWQHPQRGLLLPGVFLPVIEDHDLAIDVGEWVIDQALRQIGEWGGQGHPIAVSVNVSARHLQQSDFVERLRAILQANPAAEPASLELEITETSTVQDVAYVSEIISACLGMGIQVAIDDFGTGYSSLTYLKKLPAPVLKLDQTFVRDMLHDPDDLAILQGIIGLANAFRRTVVAEGVETVEQGLMLLRMGCTYAQGYGIARPMPAAEVVTWYHHWWPDPRWREAEAVNPQNWPVLVAQVEVLNWMRSLQGYMRGLLPDPPEMDESRSRFGAWLDAERAGLRGAQPVFRRLEKLQRQMHVAARLALTTKQNGDEQDPPAPFRTAMAIGREIENELERLLLRGDRSQAAADIATAMKTNSK
jgi:diguanylate cyclase (GGDEF)-like protein/PAS domain S-box-containing protein